MRAGVHYQDIEHASFGSDPEDIEELILCNKVCGQGSKICEDCLQVLLHTGSYSSSNVQNVLYA